MSGHYIVDGMTTARRWDGGVRVGLHIGAETLELGCRVMHHMDSENSSTAECVRRMHIEERAAGRAVSAHYALGYVSTVIRNLVDFSTLSDLDRAAVERAQMILEEVSR